MAETCCKAWQTATEQGRHRRRHHSRLCHHIHTPCSSILIQHAFQLECFSDIPAKSWQKYSALCRVPCRHAHALSGTAAAHPGSRLISLLCHRIAGARCDQEWAWTEKRRGALRTRPHPSPARLAVQPIAAMERVAVDGRGQPLTPRWDGPPPCAPPLLGGPEQPFSVRVSPSCACSIIVVQRVACPRAEVLQGRRRRRRCRRRRRRRRRPYFQAS